MAAPLDEGTQDTKPHLLGSEHKPSTPLSWAWPCACHQQLPPSPRSLGAFGPLPGTAAPSQRVGRAHHGCPALAPTSNLQITGVSQGAGSREGPWGTCCPRCGYKQRIGLPVGQQAKALLFKAPSVLSKVPWLSPTPQPCSGTHLPSAEPAGSRRQPRSRAGKQHAG